MKRNSFTLFIEINNFDFNFIVGVAAENNDFKILHKINIPSKGLGNNKIDNFDLIFETFKTNISLLEKKINFIFKDVIIILNNFECSLINLTGYKKLNGSQLLKDNITYIINSLKSKISEVEKNKTIIHIFNSKFFLDKKNIENLPIGLFGDFYSHELSFFLINTNDFKNISQVLFRCNLKIKKIISKNFIEGVNFINENSKLETFFMIELNKYNSQLVLFENSSLKYIQKFKFGHEIILDDISKITKLNKDIIEKIIKDLNLTEKSKDELIEKKYFVDQNYRKIKKKLILDIARARIQEISEIILFKNVNTYFFLKKNIPIYLNLDEKLFSKNFRNIYNQIFSNNNRFKFSFFNKRDNEHFINEAFKIVQYGWKKEAVPIVHEKKSVISRFFDIFFRS